MDKFRLFNARPIVIFLISLCVGILICNYLFTNIALAILIFVVFLTFTILYATKLKQLSIFLINLIVMLVGFVLMLVSVAPLLNVKDYTKARKISGEIINISEGSYSYILIKDAKIDDEEIKGAISVCYTGEYALPDDAIGTVVVFYVNGVSPVDIVGSYDNDDILNSYYLDDNVKYTAESSSLEIVGKYEHLYLKIRNVFKSKIFGNFTNENANIMFSALFGDKRELSHATRDSYNLSGLAHLLAVSGLHVGLISGCLMFILKFCKVRKKTQAFIIIPILVFYCYLCAWTPSVIRATIMTSALLISSVVNRGYDNLSSIAFAGFLILLIEPWALFNASFLMSFGCVLGIALFYTHFRKGLIRLRICNKLTESITLSIIVNLVVSIVTLYLFGEINFMSIVTNTLVLPLFSMLFSCTFVVVLLSFIPYVANILNVLNFPFDIVNLIIQYFAKINKIFVGIDISFFTIILFIILLVFCSKFMLKKSTTKYTYISIITLILISQILINNYLVAL